MLDIETTPGAEHLMLFESTDTTSDGQSLNRVALSLQDRARVIIAAMGAERYFQVTSPEAVGVIASAGLTDRGTHRVANAIPQRLTPAILR